MKRGLLDQTIELARTASSISDLAAWRARHERVTDGASSTLERAILGGASMDRLAYVFASGYRCALEALAPSVKGVIALAATEAGGNHPRAIEARFTETGGEVRLDGKKEWTTLPTASTAGDDAVLVVGRHGEDASGRPALRVAKVRFDAPGVTVTEMPELPFIPEIPHGKLSFEGARVEALLPGDGYDDYLKPFRTIEDLHVHAAILAHVLGLALRGRAPRELVEPTLALLTSASALSSVDARAPSTHLALAGLLELGRELIARASPSAELIDEEAQRWRRDLPLLQVATRPRRARLEKARAALTSS